jgi:hypothetical protein
MGGKTSYGEETPRCLVEATTFRKPSGDTSRRRGYEGSTQYLQGVGHGKMPTIPEKDVHGLSHVFDGDDIRRIEEDGVMFRGVV